VPARGAASGEGAERPLLLFVRAPTLRTLGSRKATGAQDAARRHGAPHHDVSADDGRCCRAALEGPAEIDLNRLPVRSAMTTRAPSAFLIVP
jgi:hypothetical protein